MRLENLTPAFGRPSLHVLRRGGGNGEDPVPCPIGQMHGGGDDGEDLRLNVSRRGGGSDDLSDRPGRWRGAARGHLRFQVRHASAESHELFEQHGDDADEDEEQRGFDRDGRWAGRSRELREERHVIREQNETERPQPTGACLDLPVSWENRNGSMRSA